MPKEKTTLEKILMLKGEDFSEEQVHTAMLLSFAESVYSIIRRDCTPSPLYRVGFDKKNHSIMMEETSGHSKVPQQGVMDIDEMDILMMANLRDLPSLMEGETGIGKTFVSQRYLSTIFPKSHYFSHRLSANAFVNNLFQHFQEGKMQNGMPIIEARTDRIETTAAGIVDEINRGDPNETLQLFDNEMHLNGIVYKLGIPIPEIKALKYLDNNGKKKKMFLISAQNPAASIDAKFTGTMELDAAVDNRLLKVYMSNAAPSAGSTLWLGDGKGKRHEVFLSEFIKRTSNYLNLKEKDLANPQEGWLSTYAWITDPTKTDKPILYSALELADFMTAIFGGNMINYYNYERQVLSDWNEQLGKNIEIKADMQETAKVKKIHEVVGSFKVPIIFRDIVQMKKVADILSTLKNIKDAAKMDNPVQSYIDAKKLVTIREVGESTALICRNKQKPASPSPVEAINEVLNQYRKLTEDYMGDAKKFHPSLEIYDPSVGIKNVALIRAIRESLPGVIGIDSLINNIAEEAKRLTTKISASEEVRNVLIARSASDLMTLCGFLNSYRNKLKQYRESEKDQPFLEKYKKPNDAENILEAIGKFYCKIQKEEALILPDIYQHRIQRTLGIENVV